MKTLKKFLEKHSACEDGYDFAKDLTLEQFLNTCERGEWILWLFARMNPNSLKELTLAKGHCANTVRHLMKDQRSIDAVEAAIAFGEGKISREELDKAKKAADAAADAADADVAADAASAASAAVYAASAAASAAVYAAWAAAASGSGAGGGGAGGANACYTTAKRTNQKLTADICRKYLPLEIWDITQLN